MNENGYWKHCCKCQGTGKVSRPATWDDVDIVEIVRVFNSALPCEGGILKIKRGG